MVLTCEIGIVEGKPLMEQYGLDELAASADAVVPGLGPLATGLARLAAGAGRAVTLEAMELMVAGRGRELLRGLLQLCLDGQAAAEVRVPRVTGTDGMPRPRAERGHARTVVTTLGAVRVRRIAYRSGVRGVRSLFPRDAVLNLPPCRYSWPLQRLAEMFCQAGSYEQARGFVRAATGAGIGKRQLQQITARAAADAERFCQDPGRAGDQAVPAAGPGEQDLPPLAISADGKGVAMLPGARRRRTRAPGQRVRNFKKRPGTGEKKGHKRMAETGCVFDVLPPDQPRTPEQVMAPGGPKTAPRAANRWYACDITAGRDVTIGKIFDQAGRRDPGHARTWIALVDGDNYQLGLFQAAAAARGITLAVVIDFIHVLEYLWKAAWCFHPPRDPAMEDWVTAQALDILHGRVRDVIERIGRLAAEHPPQPGSEHAKIIRKTLHYLDAKQPWMDYPRALAAGWPIATGVIEGACRHLVADRMVFSSPRHVDLCPPIRQTVRAGCSSASYRLPRVRVSRGCERPGVPGGAARRPGEEYVRVAVADQFLFDLRFGRDRAESTTRVYAGELARFLTWCGRTGRSLEDGAQHLSRFVLVLRTTPAERAGAGQGRPPGAARINHVLAVVREFFKHAVADKAVDASVLGALYEVGDDRFLPAELRAEGGGLRYRARPRHRLRTGRAASPEAASQAEWEALLEAATSWRERFLLVLLWFCGLRIGETLGLRRADLHFTGSSTSLGCQVRGPHLHVVHRDGNPNGASAKSRNERTVPVVAWVLAYYDRYTAERLACPAADGCDFVFVNLFHAPLGAPMTASAVRQVMRVLSGSITSAQHYVHPSRARMRSAVEAVEKVTSQRRIRRQEGGPR